MQYFETNGESTYYLSGIQGYADYCAYKLENIINKLYARAIDAIRANSFSLERTLYYDDLNDFNVGNVVPFDYFVDLKFKNDRNY